MLLIKKLHENAIAPRKNLPTDLGYDLFALEDCIVKTNQTQLVKTGIALKFPDGWGGFIKDRSSIATKKLLEVTAGVIDENYTGEIQVAFHNNHIFDTEIKAGDKIAQIVPIPVTNWDILEVDELPDTDRGNKGFGSSGK